MGILTPLSKQDFIYKTVSETFLDILSVKGKRSCWGIDMKYSSGNDHLLLNIVLVHCGAVGVNSSVG